MTLADTCVFSAALIGGVVRKAHPTPPPPPPLQGFLLGPEDKDRVTGPWRLIVRGPAGSPYADRQFVFGITLPATYPFNGEVVCKLSLIHI